ncbi:MAG: TolC family protein [Phycisphaerales bacterium]|nr:TolC family protein [Phycisphaerales bacterium]
MKRIIPILLYSVVLVAARAQAQETVALSLKDCIDFALKNSTAAKNARIDVQLQKAQNDEVTGKTMPQISGEGRYTQFFDIQQQFIPADAFDQSNPALEGVIQQVGFSPKLSNVGQLNASQLLFNGSVFVALQARNTLMKLARQKEEMTDEEIRYNVQKAYAGILIAHKQFDVMKKNLELLHQSTDDMNITYQNGLAEKIELNRLEVQLSNLQSDSLGLDNTIDINEKLLKFSIGMKIDQKIELTEFSVVDNLNDASNLLLQENSVNNNINYQLAYTSLQLQEYDLKRYRFEGLPTLSAFGSTGYNRSSNKLSDLINKSYPGFSLVGLQLNVPIFDGMQRRNRVKYAKLKVEKAENDLENAKLDIDYKTKSAKANLINALQTSESRKRTMDLASTVLDLAQKKYKAGVGSNQDVIIAQGDFLKAQGAYFEAVLTVVNTKADLQKALGLLK